MKSETRIPGSNINGSIVSLNLRTALKVLSRIGLNERQLKTVKYVKEKGRITNKEYREMSGLSDEGARVDLNDLVEKGVLLPKGKGRNTHYVLK